MKSVLIPDIKSSAIRKGKTTKKNRNNMSFAVSNIPNIENLPYDDLIILSNSYSRASKRKGSAAFVELPDEVEGMLSDAGKKTYIYISKYKGKPVFLARMGKKVDEQLEKQEKKYIGELKVVK